MGTAATLTEEIEGTDLREGKASLRLVEGRLITCIARSLGQPCP